MEIKKNQTGIRTETKTEGEVEQKPQQYVSPQIKKHQSMAVVSGSDCTYVLDSDYNYV
jgi:hypothetical protein